MDQVKKYVDLAEGILETEKGLKAFKNRSHLMRQYNDRLSRINENKRIQQQLENTERIADKYNHDYGKFKESFLLQRKRFEKRGFFLKQEAEELRDKIEENNDILKGEK